MKLLSTLFTALALVASVFTAPKAMAQDDDFDDSTINNNFYNNGNEAILYSTPTYNTEKGYWTIILTKSGYEAYQYITLYIKADATGFDDNKTYTFADLYKDDTHVSGYNSCRYAFTKMKDITFKGNPLNGACEISGTALYNNRRDYVCKFKYVKEAAPRDPENYERNFTEMSNPTYSVGAWDIMLGNKYDTNYLAISLKTGSRSIFAGSYTLSDCDATMTECKIDGHSYKFSALTFTITGDADVSCSISGSGTLSNDDTIEFSYVGVKTKESVVFQYDYASYYNADHNVVIPEGVEACVVYVDSEGLHVTPAYTKDEVVSAGTPVLLHGSGIVTLNYTETTGKDLEGFVENHLEGAATNLYATDITSKYSEDEYYFYGLMLGEADNAESEGFYWHADEGKAFYVPAGKVYLPVLKSLVDSLDGARAGFSLSDATGIRTVAVESQNAAMFNICGQRIQEAKGLVIRGGKMMFVK